MRQCELRIKRMNKNNKNNNNNNKWIRVLCRKRERGERDFMNQSDILSNGNLNKQHTGNNSIISLCSCNSYARKWMNKPTSDWMWKPEKPNFPFQIYCYKDMLLLLFFSPYVYIFSNGFCSSFSPQFCVFLFLQWMSV